MATWYNGCEIEARLGHCGSVLPRLPSRFLASEHQFSCHAVILLPYVLICTPERFPAK